MKLRELIGIAAAIVLSACKDGGTAPVQKAVVVKTLPVLGSGLVSERYTGEVSVYGDYAYTTTWSKRGTVNGNAVKVWNVAGNQPVLVDSLIIADATTTGDVQAIADVKLLVVATERANGSIAIYSLNDPAHPSLITRYSSVNTTNGVHTAEVQRVNGVLYGFLSIDPAGSTPARLTIVDLSDPAHPHEVFSAVMGNPFVHDVFVRDGLLFTALWNDGVTIWDIGGGARGGTPSNPIQIGNTLTVGGQVHNIWWLHDPVTLSTRYAFVGEEGPGTLGSGSSGDIHVVDVSNMAAPHEVAFFHVDGAGTHNFSLDEPAGILYAAYYNGGVRAINIRGDLGSCTTDQRAVDGRCDLMKMGRQVAVGLQEAGTAAYVWGVQKVGTLLYASDMLNGLFKLDAR
ncbi:MAG: hypothetical protein M3081_16875 [Gemmatimonadota bacterium]|nr:hypothetical protein [Gemmatimonadota bacterium]